MDTSDVRVPPPHAHPVAVRSHPRRSAAARWLRRFWAPLLLVAIAIIGTVPTTLQHEKLSVLDEWVYTDYLYKVPEQGIVHQGESVGDEARALIACVSVRSVGFQGPPCGGDVSRASDFPNNSVTTADAYSPLYFTATRWVGDAIHEVTGVDQLTGWRLTGTLWLSGGLLLFYGLLRRWQIPRTTAVAIGLLVVGSPLSWWTFTFVSTDAPAFAVGAALLLAATDTVRGTRAGPWLFLGISAIAVLLKVSNILAVCLAALYLGFVFLRRWRERRSPGGARAPVLFPLLVALGGLLVAVAVELGWLALRSSLAVGPSPEQGVEVHLTVAGVLDQFVNFLPNAIAPHPISEHSLSVLMMTPLSWLCIAGVVGSFFLIGRGDRRREMVTAVALGAVILAPLLAVALSVATGIYFPLPARYGAVILPGFLLLLAFVLRNRWATALVATYGVALIVVSLAVSPEVAP